MILKILIIHIIVSYDQNISMIFYVKDVSHVRLWHPSVLCLLYSPETVHVAVLKMRTPCWNSYFYHNTLSLYIYLSIYLPIYLSIYLSLKRQWYDVTGLDKEPVKSCKIKTIFLNFKSSFCGFVDLSLFIISSYIYGSLQL